MPALPSFVALLAPERLVPGVRAASKAEVLRLGAGWLATHPAVRDRALLAADLEAREERLSTGVGDGVAIPHARTRAVTETVAALATLAEPVEWDAFDGRPVDLVVLFAGPEAEQARHLRLLAQVSRVLAAPGLRAGLAAAAGEAEALAVLRDAEASVG